MFSNRNNWNSSLCSERGFLKSYRIFVSSTSSILSYQSHIFTLNKSHQAVMLQPTSKGSQCFISIGKCHSIHWFTIEYLSSGTREYIFSSSCGRVDIGYWLYSSLRDCSHCQYSFWSILTSSSSAGIIVLKTNLSVSFSIHTLRSIKVISR